MFDLQVFSVVLGDEPSRLAHVLREVSLLFIEVVGALNRQPSELSEDVILHWYCAAPTNKRMSNTKVHSESPTRQHPPAVSP